LVLNQNGSRIISCLSSNHANHQPVRPLNPDPKSPALAKVLLLVWGHHAWMSALSERFLMVYNNRKSIAYLTVDEEGCPTVKYLSLPEVEQMYRGKHVYLNASSTGTDACEPSTTTATSTSRPDLWSLNKSPLTLWNNWEHKPRYEGITYRPNAKCSDGYINMWSGFAVAPNASPEGPVFLLRHIREVICSDNDEHYEYVLNCLAHLIQRPEIKLGVILVLYGRKGTGKSTLADALRKIFGKHAIEVVNSRHFTGNFNTHNRYKNLIILNEAFWGGDKQAEGIMKAATTECSTIWEGKGENCVEGVNYWNMIITSDNPFCAPITQDNRRFFVLELSAQRRGDFDYFRQLHNALENEEETEKFLHFLQMRHLPPRWRAPEKLPKTKRAVEMFLEDHRNVGMKWIINKAKSGEWRSNYGMIGAPIISLFQESPALTKEFVLRAFQAEQDLDPILKKNVHVTCVATLTKFFKELLGDNFGTIDNGKLHPRTEERYKYQFAPMTSIREHLERTLGVDNYFDRTDEEM
jgi:energy-coupling factor transporter ATP-binding protein EcfA2